MSFLFVDQILTMTPGQSITGVKHVTTDDVYLQQCENSDKYAFMSALIGETIGQLAAWNVMHNNNFTLRPVAGVVPEAWVYGEALVGETIHLSAEIFALDENVVRYSGKALVHDTPIFEVNNALGPMLPMQDFIDNHLVREQFARLQNNTDRFKNNSHKKDPTLTNIAKPFVFDKITDFVAKEYIVATKTIDKNEPFFADHFPNKPVLPMTVLIQFIINLLHKFVKLSEFSNKYIFRGLRKTKMSDFIAPGSTITTTLKVKKEEQGALIITAITEVLGKRVCVMEAYLEVDK